jgi:hypothetical protein
LQEPFAGQIEEVVWLWPLESLHNSPE